MKQMLLSTLLATTILGAPLAAQELSGSRPGTYLPQVSGTFKPNAEFRPILDGLRLWVSNHCEENGEVMEVYDRLITAMGKSGAFKDDRHLQTIDALFFAAQAHHQQTRKSPPFTPYIVHPIGVALILWEEGGVRDADLLAAALLHDTVQENSLSLTAIDERFGSTVATLVNEVTGQVSAQISPEGKQLALADKLYNVRNLQVRTPVEFDDQGMTPWSEERVGEYLAQAGQTAQALRGANTRLEHQLDTLLGTA